MKRFLLYLSVFCILLILGCGRIEPLAPDGGNPPGAFPLNAPEDAWDKIDLNYDISHFAFDSEQNIYFINSGKLYCADKYFSIKDSSAIPLEANRYYARQLYISENNILFLARNNGLTDQLLVSNDLGKTWFIPATFRQNDITNIFSKGDRIYITSGQQDESASRVQISEDNGNTWRIIICSRNTFSFDFCIENETNEIFFMGTGAFYYSNNYGLSYTERKFNFTYRWVNSGSFGFRNDIIIGNGGGIYITKNNGETWECVYGNTVREDYFSLFGKPDKAIYALHGYYKNYNDYKLRGVYVSHDGGISWYRFLKNPPGTCMDLDYKLGNDNFLYILCKENNYQRLYRSRIKLY